MIQRIAEIESHPLWPKVTADDDGIRPAGRPDRCFYCGRDVGHPHAHDCVIVDKLVELEVRVELPNGFVIDGTWLRQVPHEWNQESIEFKFNEGSWCAGNIESERDQGTITWRHSDQEEVWEKLFPSNEEEADDGRGCMCGCFSAKYIRTVDDIPRTKTVKNEHVAPRAAL